jgi:hypothetical protein
MSLGTFIKLSFCFLAVVTLYFLFDSYQNGIYEFSDRYMITHFTSVPFISSALLEIHESRRIDREKKYVWTIGLLVFPFIAGLIYLILVRKKAIA